MTESARMQDASSCEALLNAPRGIRNFRSAVFTRTIGVFKMLAYRPPQGCRAGINP
jgi:hypothetical protein